MTRGCFIHPETRYGFEDTELLEALSVRDLEGLTCLDALSRFVAEDLAIIRRDPAAGTDWLAWIHLAFPNHWSPAEKVGRSFLAVHEPVADFERVARTADRLLEALVHRGPFVRFAWGVATDTVLDHHPDSPPSRTLSDPSSEAAIAYKGLGNIREPLVAGLRAAGATLPA